ncbi:hypothetical protein [Streptomyces sp. NPDC021115]|uniref:hypothetical protein n=1 Tax=Streptomyces sp. NPDC021115 TaxID=3365115 RepID=UPI0037BDC1C6
MDSSYIPEPAHRITNAELEVIDALAEQRNKVWRGLMADGWEPHRIRAAERAIYRETARTAFTPTIDDVQDASYGALVADIDEDGHLIAIGVLNPRRALAAFNRYARTIRGGTVLGTLAHDEMRDDLAVGDLCLVPGIARFLRHADGSWTVDRVPEGSPGCTPAVWLVPPWHPAHSREHCAGGDVPAPMPVAIRTHPGQHPAPAEAA